MADCRCYSGEGLGRLFPVAAIMRPREQQEQYERGDGGDVRHSAEGADYRGAIGENEFDQHEPGDCGEAEA